MSQALTDAQMLSIWERGIGLSTTARALLILGAGGVAGTEAPGEWPVGRRDVALLGIRRATFGDRIASRTRCPRCSCELEFELDGATLLGPVVCCSDERRVVLEQEGVRIDVRAPTSMDLLELEKLDSAQEVEAGLWARCVVTRTADGNALEAKRLTADQRRAVEEALEAGDPCLEVCVELECSACAARWVSPFDIAFVLWLEIVERARGALNHVHLLARRYGWTERDVLALGQRRREMYLALPES